VVYTPNLKSDDDLNYLAEFVEQLFSKSKLNASESEKIFFFSSTSPKLKILIKNALLYRKRTRKVFLNIFAVINQNRL
jgi:hypothetical protein